MAWTIVYALSARKSVEKIDSITRKRIRDFLEIRLAGLDDPRSLGHALTGPYRESWRYRVGDYRIICEIEDRRFVILAVEIGHRRDIYKH